MWVNTLYYFQSYLFYLKSRDIRRAPICWFTPQRPAAAWILDVNLDLPRGWRGHNYLNCPHLGLPQMHISRKLRLGVELGLERSTPEWDSVTLRDIFMFMPNTHPTLQ